MASRGKDVGRGRDKERVFDEMLSFLSEPIFQIPVRSFLDENCLIFDIDGTPEKEHRAIFDTYKKLIDTLLEAFCTDVDVTPDEVVQGITRLNKIPDLHDMFYFSIEGLLLPPLLDGIDRVEGLFEQVLAAVDFNLFYPLMAKRNIMIQEQVLAMIIASTGILPESLSKSSQMRANVEVHPTRAAIIISSSGGDRHEEELLKQVIRRSDMEEGRKSSSEQHACQVDARTLDVSQKQAKSLEADRKYLEEQMKKMVLETEGDIMVEGRSQNEQSSHANKSDKSKREETGDHRSAASQWMQSAQNEHSSAGSNSRSALVASLSKLSPDEIQQRQEFLRQQRDKLLAMKKEAREKQLQEAERTQSKRPVSARAARSALSKGDAGVGNSKAKAEDDKKLAMRRAIAEKLRQEVIGNQ